MESFFTSIGGIVFYGGIFLLILLYIDRKSKKERDNRDLAKYLDDVPMDPHKSYDQKLSKVLSNPEVRQKAENLRSEEMERERMREERDKKKYTKARVYSYDHESLIYQIFAPFRDAKPFAGEWHCSMELENDFVISEIARIKKDSINEAEKLFSEFKDNELVFSIGKKCRMGLTLKQYWNVVTDEDLNFTKWVNAQTNIESRESAEKRRKAYDIKTIVPLTDFIKSHGKYTLENDDPFYVLYFNQRTQVEFLKSIIDFPKSEFAQHIHDFVVVEDNGYLTLQKK